MLVVLVLYNNKTTNIIPFKLIFQLNTSISLLSEKRIVTKELQVLSHLLQQSFQNSYTICDGMKWQLQPLKRNDGFEEKTRKKIEEKLLKLLQLRALVISFEAIFAFPPSDFE